MQDIDRGQIITSAAEVYEAFFLPALFQEWPARVAAAADIKPGQRVLDVACGTGVLARTLVTYVGSSGSVVGLDINPAMLVVARRNASNVEWHEGRAEELPFDEASFDAVVSQFGLMFFEDRPAAIREMIRVLRPRGRLAVAVWASLDDTPGYAAMVKLLQRLFGEDTANALRAPFSLGDQQRLQALFPGQELTNLEVKLYEGHARFPSIDSWVHTDIRGWTLADMLTDAQVDLLRRQAEEELARFITSDGHVEFRAPAYIVTAIKA